MDFIHMNSSITFDQKTLKFQKHLLEWRSCISNITGDSPATSSNSSVICSNCQTAFDELFEFYWKIYTMPEVEFCLDVETTVTVFYACLPF